MSTAHDLARIDELLDALEQEAKRVPEVRAFTRRVLEQLQLVTGAASAAFVAAIGSAGGGSVGGGSSRGSTGGSGSASTEPTAPQESDNAAWLTLMTVGDPLAIDVGQWLPSIRSRGDETGGDETSGERLPQDSRLVWRTNGHVYLAQELSGNQGRLGAVVLSIPEPCPAAAEEGLFALIQGFGEILGERLRIHQHRTWAESEGHFDRFLTELYGADGPEELAQCLAHDLPTLLNCHRVAVVRQKRSGLWRVQAITGAVEIERRTEAVVALEELARTAAQQGRPVLCRAPHPLRFAGDQGTEPDPREAVPPDTLLLPLDNSPSRTRPPSSSGPAKSSAAGLSHVVVLQWSAAEGISGNLPRFRRVSPHLIAAWKHTNHRSRKLFSGPGGGLSPRHPKLATLLRWGAVLTVLALLIWSTLGIQVDFNIEAKGQLEPVDQRTVFASHDGRVEELSVEDGSEVNAGQLLVQLQSADLELRQREIESEIATAQKRRDGLSIAINQLDSAQRDTLITSRQLAAEIASLDEKLKGLAKLQELLREQQDSLSLRSPIEGTVVTWDAKRNLESRPVKRGDALLKVAQISGPWRLRLWVPDRDLAHVKEAVAARAVGSESEAESDPHVTFRMVSRPGEHYQGELVAIGNTVQVVDDLGPVVPIDFAFDRDQVPGLQVGATAAGQIHCGRRPWWYVWTRTLIETVQRRFWTIGGAI